MSTQAKINKLAIIAGSGLLPLKAIESCQQTGQDFHIFAISGFAAKKDLQGFLNVTWVRLGAFGKLIRAMKKQSISHVMLIGAVKRPRLRQIIPDVTTLKLLLEIRKRRIVGDSALLDFVKLKLQNWGFNIVGLHEILPSLLAPKGVLTTAEPSSNDLKYITHGFDIAKGIGALDIGQAILMQEDLVIGVEAIEGTDALIQRCSSLLRGQAKAILIKVKKPQQDKSLDLPTIGVNTILNAKDNLIKGIAVEADNVLIASLEEVINLANENNIFIVGI